MTSPAPSPLPTSTICSRRPWQTARQARRYGEGEEGRHVVVVVVVVVVVAHSRTHTLTLSVCLQEGLPLDGSVLIGNKRDLEERYDVAAAEGHKKAQQHGLEFFEASALKGPDGHIDEPFNCLAAKYYQAYLATKEHYELGV